MMYVFDNDDVLKPYSPASEVRPFDKEAVRGMQILKGKGYTLHVLASGKTVDYLLAVARETARLYGLDEEFFNGLDLIGENGAVVANTNNGMLKVAYAAPQDGYRELGEALADNGYQKLRKALEQNTSPNPTWIQFQIGEMSGSVIPEGKRAIRTLLFRPDTVVVPVHDALQSTIDRHNLLFYLHSAVTSTGGFIDIVPKGVDKSTGLRFESQYNNVGPEQMRVIVDGENDIPMVEYVGRGSRVVGNGHPVVIERVKNLGGRVVEEKFGAGVLKIAELEESLL